MAALTERALKRRKVAVLLVQTKRDDVLGGNYTADFEWFNTVEAATEWMDGPWQKFCKEDSEAYTILDGEDPAMAYLNIMVTDTETMTLGKVSLFPETPETEKWRDEITADITVLIQQPEAKPAKKQAVVKARRRGPAVGMTDRSMVMDDEEEAPTPKAKPKAKASAK